MNWFTWALLSAFFAGLTAVLAKVGVAQIDSNMATAIRTVVILIFAWAVALLTDAVRQRNSADNLHNLIGRRIYRLDAIAAAVGDIDPYLAGGGGEWCECQEQSERNQAATIPPTHDANPSRRHNSAAQGFTLESWPLVGLFRLPLPVAGAQLAPGCQPSAPRD